MQREFTVSTFLKIVNFILGAAMISFGIFLFNKPNNGGAVIYFVPLFMAAMGLFVIINAIRRKVTIENGTITFTTVFKTLDIAVDDVKGVKIDRKVLVIVSNTPGTPNIVIRNYNDLNNNNELTNYLTGTFSDLDANELEDEKKNLLQDPNLGFTPEERQSKLDNAKKIAITYTVAGIAVAIATIALRQPIFTILALICPLLAIPIIITSNGLIKFLSNGKNSVYPYVIFGFIAPTVALFAKSLAAYHFYNYDSFWLPFIGIGVVVGGLLFKVGVNESLSNGIVSQGILMLCLSLFYAFGAVGQINCGFDNSPDQIYKASVLGHHISHGKSTAYYLYLSTWGPCHENKQVDVGSKMYYSTQIGDSVKIDLKPGLLHIPWFVVKKS
ncbi:hypothetical protein [Mucilaginibacter sp. dw_454]|uniref:hypothetical protein n=1 Tax=Mucilaginibacter sp. dw_454 TaxID=2720079 RepID=UPI001BD69BA6|nr:hypothetical protein [Mucilaginibacter sp. dw_454]